MKKVLLATIILLAANVSSLFAQPGIFDPNDSVVNYDPSHPPAMPSQDNVGKWVRTPKLTWNTDKFKAYIYNGMAFRLRYPDGYNPADTSKKYPVILFFHGGGEVGPITDNDYQLNVGAQRFERMIDSGQFNAFMLFPQQVVVGWNYPYMQKVNGVLDSLQKYTTMDPDRVISMGISAGAYGAMYYSITFPERSATTIAASPALIDLLKQNPEGFIHVPFWLASGGTDINPNPPAVQEFVDSFANKGGKIRYDFYPMLGHLCWDSQWDEPNVLLSTWYAAHKANPLIYFNRSKYTSALAITARIGISAGYFQYQWQKDGIDMPGSVSNEIMPKDFGSYRVRFKRFSSSNWSVWSPIPAVISQDNIAPSTPLNLQSLYGGRTYAYLDWDNSTDNDSVNHYDIYVNGIKKYTSNESSFTADNLLPNTAYTFTVKAVDQAGNASISSNTVTVTTTSSPGLKYRYYQGLWNVVPNFNTLIPLKSGTTPNIDIVTPRLRDDSFGFVWEGYINIPTAGTYTFETTSNDGSQLYFNSFYKPNTRPLLINDGSLGTQTVSATVSIPTAGKYPISMTFFDKFQSETMQVYWTGPGIDRQLIPDIAFSGPDDTVPPSTPANLHVLYTGRTSVNLDWDNSTDNIGVAGYDIYVNGVKTYTTTESAITADKLSPNTAYTFTVKAFDQGGNVSTVSNSASGTTAMTSSGLKYRYYQGLWDVVPDFNTLTPIKTGTTPNIDIVTPRLRDDSFGFVWEGYINIATAGTYTFETTSNDGSQLYFNSLYNPAVKALLTNDGTQGTQTVFATVDIQVPGRYPIAMTFFDKYQSETMQVYWTGPGITRQLIPDSAFIDTTSGVNLPPAPANLKVVNTANTFVTLDWDDIANSGVGTSYEIDINNIKKYTSSESAITADSLLPNTTYIFTVKAVDQAGNISAASTPVSVTTSAIISGLKYRYYEGQWNIMPNFNTLTPIKSGNIANTDIITPRNRVDSFGFVWEGYINIPAAGTYTFETTSNDGSQFFFNSFYKPGATALLTNDGTHGTATVSASITVPAAGRYPVAMTFFDRWDAEIMQVYWTGPGIAKQLIPDKAFADPASDAIPPSTPANLKVLYTGKTYVNLDWDNATDNVGVTGYDVYVNDVKTYTTTESAITADKLLPNTSYTFTVKAFDVVGNNSIASNPAIGTTTASSAGLNYRYYQGQWNITPNYNTLTPIKTGSSPNIDIITPRNRDDSFGFVWEGYINIPTAGTYTFETTSNDGSQLYFNSFYNPKDTALLTNDGTQGTQTVSASISVPAAGLYPIAMTFFDRWDAEMMQVYWTGPGITKQLIPNVAFADPSSDVIPPSAPANLHVLYSGKTYVNLDWDTATDNVGVTGYDIYVNNVKTYTTTASAFTADKLLPNTAYTFMVKAFDLIGNNSHESNSVSGSTTAVSSGLNYRYYQGQWDVVPNFNLLTPIKTGSSPNIDIITPRNRDDSFGFVWEGYLNVPMAGTYTFETISNDGSQLYFNSFYNPALTPLLTNDGTHGTQTVTATISIPTAGMYPVAMTFFDKYDAESMQVYWTGPGIPRQLIPTVAFADPNSDAIPPSTPANLHVLYTGKTYVNLDWDNATDNVGVTGYNVYVNNVKTYTTTSSAITADKLLPGTSYTFSVKAFDLLGNNSSGSASATGTTTTTVTGLNYRYYEALWNIVPNFNALTPIKSGPIANTDIITPRNRSDSFGFVWEGYINIQIPGTYTFETTSNDGSQLYFNSFYNPSATALLTNDGTHGTATVSASVSVPTAGLYPIAMTFFDKWDAEIMQVYWSGPGIPKQLIPNSAFINSNPSAVVQNNSVSIINTANLTVDVIGASDETVKILKAYPNPVADWLNIDLNTGSSKGDITVELFDINGKLFYKNNYQDLPTGNNTLRMNVGNSKLAPGIYFLKVSINGIPSKVIKLLKSRN